MTDSKPIPSSRPRVSDPEIAQAWAAHVAPYAATLIGLPGADLSAFVEDLAEAFTESQDPLNITLLLGSKGYAEKLNTAFVIHLHREQSSIQRFYSNAVRQWAMEEGIRFPAVDGDEVTFDHPESPGASASGRVVAVAQSEAVGYVRTNGPNGPVLRVLAEQVSFVRREGHPVPSAEPVRMTVGFRKAEEVA